MRGASGWCPVSPAVIAGSVERSWQDIYACATPKMIARMTGRAALQPHASSRARRALPTHNCAAGPNHDDA